MKKKAKKKSKNNKRIRNWMQESQKKDISTDKSIDDKSSEEKNEDVSIEKKSRKTKTVLLSVGLAVLVIVNVLYFSGIGKRSIRELEHQTSGKISTSEGYYVGETDFGIFDGNGTLNFNGGKTLTGIKALRKRYFYLGKRRCLCRRMVE